MNNPFDMVGDMSFWIEFNAVARNANSSDLQVFLVSNEADLPDLQVDWRNSPMVELVGVLPNDATFHHTHATSSSHHLISLQTNLDGTIGSKDLDISGDFWIILYSTSPNVNRGWNLRYQPSSLCTYDDRWYTGNQFGWGTTVKEGCPDAHIHIARRSSNMDGLNASVTVNYATSSPVVEDTEFYFGVLPNLAPNPTSFISPAQGTYAGLIDVTWNPATDANNDTLDYTIDLLNADGSFNSSIVASSTATTTPFDTTSAIDGEYKLGGTICDDGTPVLCTEFVSDYTFFIDNVADIASLVVVSVSSNNTASSTYAQYGDVITLEFESDITLVNPTVEMYAGGYDLAGTLLVEEIDTNLWSATITVDVLDYDGYISFSILGENLDFLYEDTTDSSFVIIDNTAPADPTSSHVAGIYGDPIDVELISEGADEIRYTLDSGTPSCSTGTVYSVPISLSATSTVFAVACDFLDNASNVAEFEFLIDDDPPADPTANPVAGEYEEPVSVSLSSEGADIIRYTIDSGTPTCESGTLYSDPISISATSTIYAVACDNLDNASNVVEFTYTINIPPVINEPPEFINIPGEESSINLYDGQIVTENPYIIRVNVTDDGEIVRVEFYVDGYLICNVTEVDEDGLYSCAWDTSLYHSTIEVIAYDDGGEQVSLTREVEVDLDERLGETSGLSILTVLFSLSTVVLGFNRRFFL